MRLMKMAYDEKYTKAAIMLQKFFRMWQVQARIVRDELMNIGCDTKQVSHG